MPNSRNVPFFNYSYLIKQNEEAVRTRMESVFSRGAFILQKDLQDFEANLAQFLGAKYAIGLANGTDALWLALKAAGIQPGDEVILPAHTFIATAAAVAVVGGIPVPVECMDDHMVDPNAMKKAITSKTKFLMPVQINGRTCRMDEISELANEYNLTVIEDAAQALGSKYKGKFASTWGLAGTFSFYPAKVLGCFGDGGALITNNDSLAQKIYALRDHGRGKDGDITIWGYNSRLDNLQAAILDEKLKHYPEVIKRRREIAGMYQNGLADLEQLQLPPAPNSSEEHFDIYQNYEILAQKRDPLKSYLSDHGVGTLIQWGGKAIHQFEKLEMKRRPLPKTEEMFQRFLMLPINMSLSNDDVTYVVETIRSFYKLHG